MKPILYDIVPFWALVVACFQDGRCGAALAVAIVGPLVVLLDAQYGRQ